MSMKDSFALNFAVHLWLIAMKVPTGVLRDLIAKLVTTVIGSILDMGIMVIDITIDSINAAMKDHEYRDAALKAYNRATAKVYDETEKQKIREQYLSILDKFVGVRVRDDSQDS